MIPFRKTIGFRLLGITLILLALPLLVDSFILVQKRYENLLNEAKGYLVEVARERELPLGEIQPLNKPLIEVTSRFLDLKKDFPTEPSAELNEKLTKIAEIGGFSGVYLIDITADDEFIVVGSNRPDYVGKNETHFFKYHEQFAVNVRTPGLVTFISYKIQTKEPYFFVAHTVDEGILLFSLEIGEKIQEILVEEEEGPYPVDFALVLPSSIIFSATDPTLDFNYLAPVTDAQKAFLTEEDPEALGKIPDEPLDVDQSTGLPFFEFTWKGQTQIAYIKKFGGGNFSLLTYASKEAIFSSPFTIFVETYAIFGLILVLGGLIAYLLIWRMTRPIQKLSSVMGEIAEGHLQARYKKARLGFEINDLGAAFNGMVDTLVEKKRVVEQERVVRETLAAELKLGRAVQRSLLPETLPEYTGVDLAHTYVPAIEVGGDFYDVFTKEDELVIAVADASGKGVQACFYSLSARNMLRTYAHAHSEVGAAISATNNLFSRDTNETGMFVTLVMAFYNPKTRLFNYYSAGHNPLLVRRRNGEVEILHNQGMAIGVLPTGELRGDKIELHPGDAVIFYSDGITEAHNAKNALYTDEHFAAFIARLEGKNAEQMVEAIIEDVNTFANGAAQHDDITLLVMRVK